VFELDDQAMMEAITKQVNNEKNKEKEYINTRKEAKRRNKLRKN
jgi:hypothetical protein